MDGLRFRRKAAAARMGGDGTASELDYVRCARITRAASSNFYYAFALLPLERRRALHAVYAFCRFIDDIADEGPGREPADMLASWRNELDLVFRGNPTRPVSRALAENVRRFSIPRRCLEQIIEGVEMDLVHNRYRTFADLSLYCYRVASAVGLACIEIFGYRNRETRTYARLLGIAFQLTNILRDVSEDAARGRIYLPLEDLARFSVSEEEIIRGVYSSRFRRLMEFEANRARSYYDAAARALPPEDRCAMIAAEGMRRIYHALLERIVRTGYRVLDRRPRLSAPRKLYLVGRAWADVRLGRADRRRRRRWLKRRTLP